MNNSNPINNYDIDECAKSYMENIKKYTSDSINQQLLR